MTDILNKLSAPPPFQQIAMEDEVDLRAVLGTLISARWLIAGCSAVALLIGAAYVWTATPIYQVDASVQVEDSKGSALGASVKDLDGLFDVKSQAITEIELLRSRMVLGRVIDQLGLDIVVEPRYFPIIGEAIARRHVGSASEGYGPYAWGGERIKVSRLSVPANWEGAPLTLVTGNSGTYELKGPADQLLGRGRVGEEFVQVEGQGLLGVFVRELNARPGVEFSLTKLPKLRAIAGMQESLSVSEKGRQSGIISLMLQGADASQAVTILNAIANQYVRQNVERKTAEAEQTLKYLDQQLPETKSQLESAEVRYNEYRSRQGTVDVGKEGELLLQQSVAAETGLVSLQQKRKELLERFTPEHPSVKALDNQIGIIQTERGRFAGKIDTLPQTQQEVLRLTRDLQVSQEIYTGLLNNAQQLKVVRGGTVGNVRIIDYAERPLSPVQPRKSLVMFMALLIGLMVGVVSAVVRQMLRSGLKDPKQIEARTGISVFATIPYSKLQAELTKRSARTGGKLTVLAYEDNQDLAVESLRSLRTTLHFASLDAANNRLLVTGSAPGVGKSFVSVNLAAVLVASGERVLVIDGDMRRGHLNEFFGRSREFGLSEVIAGVISLDEAIYKTPIAGLDLLATGAIPPNPSELLLHPSFAKLLDQVSSLYDHVVIDCPPIMAVTDAAIIGRHVGTSLLAARFAVTPMAELETAIARLRQAGVAVNGILLNGVDDSASYGGYGYGYGYKYAYSYAYRSKAD